MRTTPGSFAVRCWVLCWCWISLPNARGQLPPDPAFNPPRIEGGYVSSMAILPDNRILLAGNASINGTSAGAIARLTANGAVDAAFKPPTFTDGPITAILPTPDGSAYIAGSFTARTGTVSRTGLAKLTPEGFLDPGVASLRELGGEFRTMVFDSKGRIVIGGGFVLNRSRSKANIVRVLPTGAVDETLNPSASNESARPTVNGPINSIIPLAEGRLLIGGSFTLVGGADRSGLARLEENGAADPSFHSLPDHDCCITDIALAAEGRILVAGSFRNFAGRGLAGIVRLHPDGALDDSYQSPLGPIATIDRMALLGDGAIAAVGAFSQAAHTNLLLFSRFFADGQMDTAWRDLAVGQVFPERVMGDAAGQLYLLKRRWISDALPPEYSLEKLAAQPPASFAPRILAQPREVMAFEGQTVVLAVDDVAHPRPTYQWQLDSADIPTGTNRILRMPSVSPKANGAYRLRISNASGSASSEPIQLNVEPATTAPGQVDLRFDARSGLFGGVNSIRKTPEGKALIWGSFSRVAGEPRRRLARLNQDGTLDETFVPETREFDPIITVSPSTNGSVVVLGTVITNNNSRAKILRLTSAGSVDSTFKPYLAPLNYWVPTMHATQEGAVYVSASYDSFSGVFRLSADGTRETAYRLRLEGIPAIITGLPEGKILLAGGFRTPPSERQMINLARLHADGALDEAFFPGNTLVNANPDRVVVAADGKILVSIASQSLGGRWLGRGVLTPPVPIPPKGPLLRFFSDGTLDSSFLLEWDGLGQLPWGDSAFTLQEDGSIIVSTLSYSDSDSTRFSLARFFQDGARDYGFVPVGGPYLDTVALAALAGERLLVTGGFPSVNGVPLAGMARLHARPSAPSVPVFLRQPEGARVPEGAELTLVPAINAALPRSFQWRRDQVNLAGETNRTLHLRNLKVAEAGDYQLVAANDGGSTTSAPAKIQVDPARTTPGAVDVSFYAGSGPNGPVNQVIELPDGKLMVHGNFDSFDGKPRPRIARLHASGALDDTFAPSLALNDEVAAMHVLDNGGLLISGPFGLIGTNEVPGIALLKPDGALDKAGMASGRFRSGGRVNRFLESPDGKRIFACGEGFLECWNPDGTTDKTFKPWNFDGSAVSMALQPDGKLVLVGNFASSSTQRPCIARINPDGTIDADFKPGTGSRGASILDVALQDDGKILVVGFFKAFSGIRRGCIARLLPDGTIDPTFNPEQGAAAGRIAALGHFGFRDATAIHTVGLDGDRIVVTGEFTTYEGVPAPRIVRLFSDGSLDLTFDIGSGLDSPETIGLQNLYDFSHYPSARWVGRAQKSGDGKIFFGGRFPGMHGVSRPRLMKVHGGSVPDGIPQLRAASPDQTLRRGTNVTLFAAALTSTRPSYQWRLNGEDIPGATRASLELINVGRADAGEYSCTVSNAFGSVRHVAGRVDVSPARRGAGAVDPSFYFDSPQDFVINTALVQSDGKIQAAGSVQTLNGPQHPLWVRVNPDGSQDAALHGVSNNLPSGSFQWIIPLEDGSTLLHGYFEIQRSPTASTNANWFRILADGAPATNYPALPLMNISAVGRWTNGQVLLAQSDPSLRLLRLNANTTLDNTFPRITFDGPVQRIALDEQGRILLVGDFTRVNSIQRNRVVRLRPDGTVDPTFDPKLGPEGTVLHVVVQPTGDLVIGGWFNRVNNVVKPYLARLRADGSLDPAFPKGGLILQNGDIRDLVSGVDGSFVLRGFLSGTADVLDAIHFGPDGAEMHRTGTIFGWSQQFGRWWGTNVRVAGYAPTGKLVFFGTFDHVDGLPRTGLARVLTEEWPRLALKPEAADGSWTLIWDEGVMEEAPSVSGPWRQSENAVSPFRVTPVGDGSFFRLRVDE